MQWTDIRKAYPDKWVLIEGFRPRTTHENKIQFDDLAVMESCTDGASAMKQYRKLKKLYPQRDLFFIHTSHDTLEIYQRRWLGISAPFKEIMKISKHCSSLPDMDLRSPDEILNYNHFGVSD